MFISVNIQYDIDCNLTRWQLILSFANWLPLVSYVAHGVSPYMAILKRYHYLFMGYLTSCSMFMPSNWINVLHMQIFSLPLFFDSYIQYASEFCSLLIEITIQMFFFKFFLIWIRCKRTYTQVSVSTRRGGRDSHTCDNCISFNLFLDLTEKKIYSQNTEMLFLNLFSGHRFDNDPKYTGENSKIGQWRKKTNKKFLIQTNGA